MFYSLAKSFLNAIIKFQRNGDKLRFTINGSAWQINYKKLKVIRVNDTIVAELTADKSHVLQRLDISIFGRREKEFGRLLNLRTVCTTKHERNDFFTICERLEQA